MTTLVAPRLRPALARAVPERRDVATAARIAAAVLAVVTIAATVVIVAGMGEAVRDALGFGFAGVPNEPGQALEIFINNIRVAGTVAAAIAVVVVADLGWGRRPASGAGGLGRRAFDAVLDVTLASVAIANAALVGAAIGAYGGRMVLTVLPHGPLELAAYALALAAYVDVRRGRLVPLALARCGAWMLGLLAVAALIETYS